MSSVNKVILIGHLGKDPEVRFFPSGQQYVNFTLATSESWKDKVTGERKSKTEWHNITITNEALVTVAQNFLRKGSKVYVEGQLQTRKYTDSKTGVERYTTEIVLPKFRGELTLLDSKNSQDAGASQAEPSSYVPHGQVSAPQAGYQTYGQALSAAYGNNGSANTASFANDLDDDIPF